MSAVARIGLVLFVLGMVAALQPSSSATAATTIVTIGPSSSFYGPFWLCSSSYSGSVCPTTITVGDTVTWQNTTSVSHTSTECDSVCGTTPPSPLWDSGLISPGGSYSRTFNQVGTFNYQCNIHPTQMKGQIIVAAAVGGIAKLPDAALTSPAQAGTSSNGVDRWAVIGGALAAGLAMVGGTVWYGWRSRVRSRS